jgi:glycerol-3-phosphate acyltransferase PlsY
MNEFLIGLGALLTGYLAGSISFSRVVTRLVAPGADLEGTVVPVEGTDATIRMAAVSATSVRFKLGPKYGLLASFLDMVKVALPVAAFRLFFPDFPAYFLTAAGGMIGHNWPLYHKFNGGYGMSAFFGAILVIDWTAVPVNFVLTAFSYLILKQVHLASIAGIFLVIPWLWFHDHNTLAMVYTGFCVVMYIIRVLPDYRTMLKIKRQKTDPEEKEQGG